MDNITIRGERPASVPNPSPCAAFRRRYPTLFAPLQSETYTKVKAGRHLALVAPTASGKTLAIAAPLFENLTPAVFVYPFRALVLDQTNQLVRYGSLFGLTENDFYRLWGGVSESDIAQAVTRPYVLITPDKLIALLDGSRAGRAAAMTILSKYNFVFDEVHCYNALMQSSLRYFIRTVKYWQSGTGTRDSRFYFLSATFPEDLWTLLQTELGMNDDDRIEGVSFTGDVTLHLKPNKENAENIATDLRELGITTNVVGIFNSAFKAWQIARCLDAHRASEMVFVGQDKMSERQRLANFRRFEGNPKAYCLMGSPAIEAGVDFDAANLVIEETYAESFLQRFGRAARSGKPAFVLCYSSTLYSQRDTLKATYERCEFLELLRQQFPLREPSELLNGLAAYCYYKLWDAPDFVTGDDLALCQLLETKGVDRLFAFRGLTPFTRYESGEYINYRTLFRKQLRLRNGKVEGVPSLERYYFAPRRLPVMGEVKSCAWQKKVDRTTYLLAKIDFKGFGTYWTVLEISPETSPLEEDDNICLRIGDKEYGRLGSGRNCIVRFWAADE
ncbi:MAG: DEAD/DEAH box helicase [Peptococcaceae bacterium]|nr:DEAD/DEAH box helicase [Peptococcaceae bacterium]